MSRHPRISKHRVIELRRERKTFKEIAIELGVSTAYIANMLADCDPFRGRKQGPVEKRTEEIEALLAGGLTILEIAEQTGMNKWTLYAWARLHRKNPHHD